MTTGGLAPVAGGEGTLLPRCDESLLPAELKPSQRWWYRELLLIFGPPSSPAGGRRRGNGGGEVARVVGGPLAIASFVFRGQRSVAFIFFLACLFAERFFLGCWSPGSVVAAIGNCC